MRRSSLCEYLGLVDDTFHQLALRFMITYDSGTDLHIDRISRRDYPRLNIAYDFWSSTAVGIVHLDYDCACDSVGFLAFPISIPALYVI